MAPSEPWVLGMVNNHNGSVCLLKGGRIVVAIQEERLSRRKRHATHGSLPSLAINYCLDYAGIRPRDLDLVVSSVVGRARSPVEDVTLNPLLQTALNGIPVITIPHHLAHAVSAFATSGFEESAVLVVDGVGSQQEDLSTEEVAAIKHPVEAGAEMISLYAASGTSIVPLEK